MVGFVASMLLEIFVRINESYVGVINNLALCLTYAEYIHTACTIFKFYIGLS